MLNVVGLCDVDEIVNKCFYDVEEVSYVVSVPNFLLMGVTCLVLEGLSLHIYAQGVI